MRSRIYETTKGNIHYWISDNMQADAVTLVFLPGLTADHRLFEKQYQFFEPQHNIFVWDCPCHGQSRPYAGFTYADVTARLHEILEQENMHRIILIGQSLGGMLAQYYIDRYPGQAEGFVAIDSAPFGDYYSKSDLFWLGQLEWMSRMFPDGLLRKSMAKMCGATRQAQDKMLEMLSAYSKGDLCRLLYIGEAAFIPENKTIDIPCQGLLILGDKDKVGKVAKYNREWASRTGFPLVTIQGAAHNSNDDQPEKVNAVIDEFIANLRCIHEK